ncbi:L-histidine N(alpha)-methyltransferase [Enterovirga rhinocerotis]|uniref:Dimethylhistidine N-methyltransferase n=1 Tax=Enterovirga rhinocerotis TaxID=1339210 RepID=A0A4R7BVV0_9HYPH|nr:L-histidine N(alpha)-methyltransferase [Enterovirga rhinocerotis]TDR90008.1 dimethylhistidine N-methyltransferase [Enterovirga rhinocerotis]
MQALTDGYLAGAPRIRDRAFLHDVLDGLSRPQKTLPAKYFYDLEGSRLFEEITRLPEYYPTRTELAILRDEAAAIGRLSKPGLAVVEFGSGSTEKIRTLLRALPDVALYVPIDVSGEYLGGEAAQLRADLPDIEVVPVIGDFTAELALPPEARGRPLLGFFPGSTIGNFEPEAAEGLLARFRALLGSGSGLIVGVDLVKPDAILNAAYDDAAGVTARFNLNLLARIARELGVDLDPGAFAHRALFNRARSRVEMHLVSRHAQEIRVGGRTIRFAEAETIHTENSYKYRPADFEALAARAGWRREAVLTDPESLFAVFVLRAE